jgi:hypothetical protein
VQSLFGGRKEGRKSSLSTLFSYYSVFLPVRPLAKIRITASGVELQNRGTFIPTLKRGRKIRPTKLAFAIDFSGEAAGYPKITLETNRRWEKSILAIKEAMK